MAWGFHMILDCFGGAIGKISNKEHVARFVEQLVKEIDMVAYGDLWIERFATHDPDKAGISFCQMIETSNIAGHFVEKNGDFYIDIFSCKEYDSETVLRLVKLWFEPKNISPRYLLRQAEAPISTSTFL